MQLWYELVQIAGDIQFTDESDVIIWQFNSSGRYSVQSLYVVVNDRGMRQVFTPVMWKIGVPPRLHIFLWLLANDKILTRNNLATRRHVEDGSCLFCADLEAAAHLMFECCVAKNIWSVCSELFDKNIGTDFESVARWWLCDKNFKVLNICTIAIMWSIWKLRNDICFQGVKWMRMQVLLFKCAQMLRSWKILHKLEVATHLEIVAGELERRGSMPPAITWSPQWRQEPRSGPNEDNDVRGPSRKSEMITDVISSSYEFDDVLSHESDVRTQPVGAETSSDALGDVLLVSYE
jgi:hypothetical protein